MWAVAALAAPLSQYTGAGYMAVTLAAAAVVPLSALIGMAKAQNDRISSFARWIWTSAVLAHMLPAAAGYWPAGGAEKIVSLSLLALAVISGNENRAARTCSTLFWLALPLFILILTAAGKELRTEWLKPYPGKWSGELVVTLLLPGVWMQSVHKKGNVRGIAGALLAVGLSVLYQGILGASLDRTITPFYEVGRTIGSVGFEPTAAVAATIGWYCFGTMMYRISVNGAESFGIPKGKAACVTALLCAGLIWLDLKITGWVLVLGSIGIWLLIPALKKFLKKDEKRC